MKTKPKSGPLTRFTSLVLVLAMLFTLLPANLAFAANDQQPANPFQDVKESDWFYDAVQYAWLNGFFKGTTDTTFTPNGAMTRGMFVTVLGRMAGVDAKDYAGSTGFTDSPENAYYAPYVKWAVKYGITKGTGADTFSPEDPVNREQMAAFFVRYFESFDAKYDTGANITTQPADLNQVSSYAKDAVQKLWKTGLLNGDGKNFDPMSNATRAEVATLCMRTDDAVETWYSEPGVESERVKVPLNGKDDPSKPEETDKPEPTTKPGGSRPGGGGGGSSGGDRVTYYSVTFALTTEQGEDVKPEEIELPESTTYKSDTLISSLPVPSLKGGILLGLYYDAEAKQPIGSEDKVSRNMTVYAKMGKSGGINEQMSINYITREVSAEDAERYTFTVWAESEEAVRAAMTMIDITNNNAQVDVDIASSGNDIFTITPKAIPDKASTGAEKNRLPGLEKGMVYKVTLKEDSGVNFENEGDTIRELNIVTGKTPVNQLTLVDDMKYIPKTEVTGAPQFEGLFTASMKSGLTTAADDTVGTSGETVIEKVDNEGTFTYSGGGLAVGDKVSIYQGTIPTERTPEDKDGYVAYVEITAVNGTEYSYKTADSKDVLFTPDVLPVSSKADKDGDADNNSITVDRMVMDFSGDQYAEIGLDSQTTIDIGDFIAFYDSGSVSEAKSADYVRIESIIYNESDDTYIIQYIPASQADVLSSMDIYSETEEEITLTDEEKEKLEGSIKTQALESGFVDEAAAYLTALAMETDGFQELAADTDFDLKSYAIHTPDGQPVTEDQLSLMAGGVVQINKKDITVKLYTGKDAIQELNGDGGIRVELIMTLGISIGNTLQIDLQAIFEQEVLLHLTTSGGAEWEWAWIFPYIADYKLNAGIQVGTYTGIGVTATAYTTDGTEDILGFNWDNVTAGGGTAGGKLVNIGKQITELMEKKDAFFDQTLVGEGNENSSVGIGGGLVEKYSNMIENADETWIEIVRQEIFALEGAVDPLHVLCFGISADFVVSANVYVTLGMTFSYKIAKQYNFSIKLFSQKTTNEVIDLDEAQYKFDFYVMGTMGVKAGIEMEIAVGLFSLSLDSIGIAAEAGVYAQLWGYFYYHLSWTASGGKDSSYSGAMYIEIGMYLEIKFKAQLFNSEKLTYAPTIYENQWPLLTLGEQMNVNSFADINNSYKYIDMRGNMAYVGSSVFNMNSMDMKSGDTQEVNFDDNSETNFRISFTDDRFSYRPSDNAIIIDENRVGTDATIEAQMFIDYKEPLSFTSQPIRRVLTVKWTVPPENIRSIFFNTQGGTLVETISKVFGDTYTLPMPGDAEAPTRAGYRFDGWESSSPSQPMIPVSGTLEKEWDRNGIFLHAKWIPLPDTDFTVNWYKQEASGAYTKVTDPAEIAAIETGLPHDTVSGNLEATTETWISRVLFDSGVPKFTMPQGFIYNRSMSNDGRVSVAGNGSAVANVYLMRDTYPLHFSYGEQGTQLNPPVTYFKKYGEMINAPTLVLGGYTFAGWQDESGNSVDFSFPVFMGNDEQTYYAKWTPAASKYRAETYYQSMTESGVYYSQDAQTKDGTTDAQVDLDAAQIPGFTLSKITVDGSEVEPGSDLLKIRADGSLVVKYYYDRNGISVTFDAGGGTLNGDAIVSVPYGGKITKPADPARDGYDFKGWKHGDTDWNFDTTIGTEAITLTAQWEAQTRTVTLDAAGGQAEPNTLDVTYGEAYGELPTPTRTGYTFDGWFTAAEGGEKVENTTVVAIAGEHTLYAHWTANTYTVKFNANSGEGEMADQRMTYDTEVVLNNTFTKMGYTFAGWAEAADGQVKYEPGAAVKNLTAENGGEIILYAIWTPSNDTRYTVNHYKAELDGSYPAEPTETEPLTGTTDTQTEAQAKTYTGFTVKDFEQTTIAADGSAIVNIYYDRVICYVYFSPNGGIFSGTRQDIPYGGKITKPADPTRDGYDFAGWKHNNTDWNFETDTVTIDTYLVAQWVGKPVTVTFDANGGTEITETLAGTVGEAYGELPVPVRTGYIFSGWYTAAEGGNKVEADTPVMTESHTLYAHWTPNLYTIRFNPNGGTGNMADLPMTYDVEAPLSANAFFKSGYHVIGWAKTPDGQSEYEPGATVKNLTDVNNDIVNLFAVWEVGGATPYTVKHYQADLEGNYPAEPTDTDTLYGDAGAMSAAKAKDYPGFTAQSITQAALAEDGSTVIEIRYDRQSFTVTFEVEHSWDDEYVIVPDPVTVPYGSKITKPSDIGWRYGYTMEGWAVGDDNTPWNFESDVVTENITLKAQWKGVPVEITLDPNGGALETTTVTGTYWERYPELPEPTGTEATTGYYFGYWTLNGDGWLTRIDTIDPITLIAYWRPNLYYIEFNPGSIPDGQIEGSMETMDVNYDETVELTQNAFTCPERYVFDHWEMEDGRTFADGASVTNLTSEGLTSKGWATVTLTAVWRELPVSYKVEHYRQDDENGTVTDPTVLGSYKYSLYETDYLSGYAGDQTEAQHKSYFDYPPNKSDEDIPQVPIAVDGSTVVRLFYDYKERQLNVTLVYGNGTDDQTITVVYKTAYGNSLPTPTRDGWFFVGWYTEAEGGDRITQDTIATIEGDHTLYARWSQNAYTLTVNNAAENGTSGTFDMAYGDTMNLDPGTRTGYTFKGWEITGDQAAVEGNVFTMGLEDAAATAIWEVHTVTITLQNNNGETPENFIPVYAYDTTEWNGEGKLTVQVNALNTQGDNAFDYWEISGDYQTETNPNGDITFTIDAPLDGNAEITLTAHWKSKYNVRIMSMDGSTLILEIPGGDMFSQYFTRNGKEYYLAYLATDNTEATAWLDMSCLEQPASVAAKAVLGDSSETTAILYGKVLEYDRVNDLFPIATAEDMAVLSSATTWKDPYCQALIGKDFKLMNDLTVLSSSTGEDGDGYLTGTFDGNNKTITYQVVNEYNRPLLCGTAETGVIQNLTITAAAGSASTSGLLVGVNSGTVRNCHVSMEAGTAAFAGSAPGGLVRENTASGRVEECTATGTFVLESGNVGAIVGSNKGTIQNCRARDISVEGSGVFGAIAGSNVNTITACSAERIQVNGTGISAFGGIVGYNTYEVTDCTVTDVTVTDGGTIRFGGIAGRGGSDDFTGRYCLISGCDVQNISVDCTDGAIGGILGASGDCDTIENCTAETVTITCQGGSAGGIAGDVTFASSGLVGCTVRDISITSTNGGNFGGIAGGALRNNGNEDNTIADCHVIGDLTITAPAGLVGGIAGSAGFVGMIGKGAKIANCTLGGDNEADSGRIELTGDVVGGIVGKNHEGSVTSCIVGQHRSADETHGITITGNNYAAGIVGQSGPSITECTLGHNDCPVTIKGPKWKTYVMCAAYAGSVTNCTCSYSVDINGDRHYENLDDPNFNWYNTNG